LIHFHNLSLHGILNDRSSPRCKTTPSTNRNRIAPSKTP